MAKKAAITKVLSCALVFVILMSVMPVSVFAVNESNNSTGNVSNRSNELVNSFMVNNPAEVMIPLFNNNTTDNYQAWSEEDNSRGDCAPIPDANMPVIYLSDTQESEASQGSGNDTDVTILHDVSNDTARTVSALGCNVYVKIDDDTCVGYEVYVDGVYKLTEGEGGTPDGYCAFYVSAGTHTIEIRKNGRSASITKNFECGYTYRWVSMPDYWCENGDHGDEVKFRGTVIDIPSEGFSGGYWWNVKVDKWISGSLPCNTVHAYYGLYADAILGHYDSVQKGDEVEVYGSVDPNEKCYINLNGESYYIKKISSELLSINVWTDKSEYKIGETVTIYYQTNKKCTAKLTITKPDGGDVVYGPNEIPASTRSKSATAGYPTGKRTVVFEAWAGDEYKKATCYFDVVDEEECEVKFRGIVMDIRGTTPWVQVDKVISGSEYLSVGDYTDIACYTTAGETGPCGHCDIVKKGDRVEVYGKRLPIYQIPMAISICGKTSYYMRMIGKPDLVIEDISWSPSKPKQGDTVTINVKTKNQGSKNAEGFYVCYYVDGSYYARDYISSLSAGSTTTTSFTWTAESGSHSIKAYADCYDAIDESNEGNNEKSIVISIPSGDKNVKIKGRVTNILYPISFPPVYKIQIQEIQEDPLNKFNVGDEVSVSYPWDTQAQIDSEIKAGDRVEAFGWENYECGYDLYLVESDHYIKRILVKTIYVDDDFVVDEPSNHKWNTIQKGIKDANDGDTILVYLGTYTENVEVTKSLKIKSTSGNPKDTIVQAKISGRTMEDNVFTVTADNVNIDGFTIKGASYFWCSGIWLNSNNCIISNNTFEDNAIGIWTHPPSSGNNIIRYNNFSSSSESGPSIALSLEATGNKVYLNSFIIDAGWGMLGNIWNSPSPITYTYNSNTFTSYLGNYWDDYQDNYPGAKEKDNTGIWNTPYEIIEDKDNYPLVETSDHYIPTTAENGTLVVKVYNVNGDPAAEVKGTTMVELIESEEVFPIAEQTIDEESKATFLDVPVGEYYINVWHDPQVERGSKEFWGQQKDISITAGTTITIDFYRHNPYVEKFYSKKDTVEINTTINIYVTIKVPPNYPDAKADVTASIDIEDKGGQIVCQITSESLNVQNGESFTFSFPYTPPEEGTYTGLAKAYIVGVGELCTDNCGWIEIFRVGEKEYNPYVSIPTCAPNHEMGYVGTTFQFVVNVTNKGSAEDTIDLSVSDTWGAEISRDSLTLLSGESEYVYVNVTGKEAGGDRITVKATSRNDNSKYSELNLALSVEDSNPLLIVLSRRPPLAPYDPANTYVTTPDYVKSDVTIFTPISIFFDLNTTTEDIREAVIGIKNTETKEIVDLTIKLPDFDVTATDFHTWRHGYNFPNWECHRYFLIWWHMCCYGISETSLLFFNGDRSLPKGASSAYDLEKKQVAELITAHQKGQPSHHCSDPRWANKEEEYRKMVSNLSEGQPVMLVLANSTDTFYYIIDKIYKNKHVVVAYKIIRDNEKSHIYLYDPNYSYSGGIFDIAFFCAAVFNTDSNEFRYEEYDLFITEEARLLPNDRTVLSVECPVNITITDEFERTIADNGTNEIPNASMFITNETKMFYLPADMTYSVEIDAYDSGTFNFTRVSPIGKDISITKFENIPVTSSTKASVDIEPGVTDYTMSIDYEGDGIYEKNIAPDVNDTIEVGHDLYPIQLHTGWNLISLPLTPEDPDILNVMSPVAGNWNSVWSYEGGKWKRYDLTGPDFLNTLTIMEPGKGYWLHMKSDDTLSISGSEPTVKSIPLSAGWNLVGYNSLNSMPTAEAMSSVAGNWNSVWSYDGGNWKRYDMTGPDFLNSLTFMEPGKGYWLNMKSPDTWTLGA